MSIELSTSLSARVASLAGIEPAAESIAHAQEELNRKLAARPTLRRAPTARWLIAASAACVAAVIAILFPFSTSTIAFADVQKHFASFKTLSFVLNTKHEGESISQMRVRVNHAGDARIDISEDVTMVVSAKEQQVLMLMHGEHTAMRFPAQTANAKEDPMAWLNDIRTYKQMAKPLGTRQIKGVRAIGWGLEIQGMQSELWSDDSGMPLTMTVYQPGGVSLDFDFSFDEPLDVRLFSLAVPQGYALREGDDD
jgi:hypothetical protein